MENRDSARMGKAVEHLVAATCILTSGLDLNVSTSLVDDEGVDLVFHRRDVPTTLAVQVKSRSMNASTIKAKEQFIANVGASTSDPALISTSSSSQSTPMTEHSTPRGSYQAPISPPQPNRTLNSATASQRL